VTVVFKLANKQPERQSGRVKSVVGRSASESDGHYYDFKCLSCHVKHCGSLDCAGAFDDDTETNQSLTIYIYVELPHARTHVYNH
jgi:hypothetical protein